MGGLAYSADVENEDQFLATVRRLGDAAQKALASGDNGAFRAELEKTSKAADETLRSLTPLSKATAEFERAWQGLSNVLKTSAGSREANVKGLRDLEAVMKSQLGTLNKNTAEHQVLERVYKSVTAETTRYAQAQRSVAYPTADISKYANSLEAITNAEKAGLASKKDTLTQLKSLQGAMAEYSGSLGKGTNELTALTKVMVSAGTATNKLESEQNKLEAAFRADYLRVYAGELKQIDANVRDLGFDRAAQEVEKVTRSLKEQGNELATNGREFNDLSRVLKEAATQQERYQKAAQDASRANDAAEIKAYAGELDRLEVTLKDTTQALGQLDSQQRALKYDAAGVQAYRTQQEGLQTVLETTGRSLDTLQTRVKDYGNSASLGARESAALEKVMRDTEGAATRLTGAQEKLAQSYRAAELGRFVTELKQIETAQKAGAISADQAATAVSRLQAEFRDYAAGLGITQRELGTFATNQREAGQSAEGFAQGLERAGASTDGLAADLNAVEGELTQLTGGLRETGTAAEQSAQGTERLGGSVRDLGSSLGNTGGDFDRLGGSIREVGNASDLSASDLRALADIETQLEGATVRLTAAQERAQNSFHSEQIRQQVAALNDLKLALEKGYISQEQFVASAKQIDAALTGARAGLEQNTRSYAGYTGALTKVESSLAQAEGRVRIFGVSAGVTAGISDQLQNVLYRLGPAGEAMGVAMFSAGAGMEGAAVGAKALNIALAVGLVGAVVGAAVAAGTLVKTAFALDTGLTDVQKSTNFTNEQLGELAKGLQQVSLATGTPTKDLLELAAVAGQMGVTGVDNVLKFTEVINKLAIASDIVGEEGAQQLAQFINVTKDANTSVGDSANLVANVLVALGNSVAGGEAKILAMAQRLGVLKSASQLSQAEILGLAGGFVDLGLTAERAEISVTSTFTAISKAASEGGAKLETFAQASGLTAQEFKKLADESPTDAFLALIGGLRQAQDAGQDLNPVLDKLAAGNNTLRNVLLTLVGGYDSLGRALGTAREESETMTAAQNELNNRLASAQGIANQIVSVFGYLRDSLALGLTPALKDSLTGVLDFVRGIAGFEQAGNRVISTATANAINIRDFTIALFGLGSAAESVGGQLGEKLLGAFNDINDFFAPLSNQLNDVQAGFENAGRVSNGFILDLLGVARASETGTQASAGLNDGLSNLSITSTFLSSSIPEVGDALGRLQDVVNGSGGSVSAYRDELEALRKKYPEAEAAIQSAIATLDQQAVAQDGVAASTFDLAQAQSTYVNLQKLALPQAQTYLDNLLALKKANPEAAASLNPLITGTQLYIKTLGEGNAANEAHAGSLSALREKRQELVDQYNNAPIGSAAQAEALQAIRAIDSQIAAADNLVAAQAEVGRTAGDMARNVAASFQAGELSARTALDSLTIRLTELKNQKQTALASGDYDPKDLQDFDRDIGEVEAALDSLEPKTVDIFTPVEMGARATYDVLGPLRAEILALGGDIGAAELATQGYGSATEGAAKAQKTWYDQVNYATGITLEQGAALRQSAIDYEANRIAIINMSNAGNDYVNAIIQQNIHAYDASRAIQEQNDAWRTLKETQDGATTSTRLSAEQMATQTEVIGSVRDALANAQAEYQRTGDLAAYLATQQEILSGATETLASAGIPAANLAFSNYAGSLETVEAQLGFLTTAQELAGDATINVANVLGEAGDAGTSYAAIMEGIRVANEGASQTARLFGDEQGALESQISTTEAAIRAAIATYGENSRTVQELQGNLAGYRAELEQTTKEEEQAEESAKLLEKVYGELGKNSRKSADELLYYKIVLQGFADAGQLTQGRVNELVQEMYNLNAAYQGLEAVSSIAQTISDSFDTTGAQESLEALKEKKDALLESGKYDGKDLQALNDDIAKLEDSISNAQLFEGLFEGVAAGAEAVGKALEGGLGAGEQALAGLGAAMGVLAEAFGDGETQISIHLQTISNGLTALSRGDFLGFIGAAIAGMVGMFAHAAEEQQLYADAIAAHGNEIAAQFARINADGSIEFDEEAYNEYAAGLDRQEKATKERLEAITKAWQEAQEKIREAQQELVKITKEAGETLNDLNRDVQDARIAFYESTNSGKGAEKQSFIAQTILDFRAQSEEFNALMGDITQKKNEYIKTYLEANPGAGRAEANAAAEKIFGPQRDALAEQFALTSATILNESAQQAKDLGLSQSQFYEAVFAGNNEILGNMTEGQRQGIIQFVELAHELGIELPQALEDAYGKVNEEWDKAGADMEEGQRAQSQATADRIQGEIDDYTKSWDLRSAKLQYLINTSTGETKAMYEEMFRVESEAYREGLNEKQATLNDANQEANTASIADIQKHRDTLKAAYEERDAEIVQALKDGQITESEAIKQRADLKADYEATDAALLDGINEGTDGIGSAIADKAQETVSAIEAEIATLNTAWARRSEELKNLIANSTGDAKAAYEQMYRDESAAYTQSRSALSDDLTKANQDLLDAQDKGAQEFADAQKAIGEKEAEALGGVFEILRQILGPDAQLIIDLIQTTYDKRRAAYLAEGQATADAAGQANQSEIDALGGVFGTLRAILGPDADVIISLIQDTYDKRQEAYKSGGEGAASAATVAAESEAQSVANINQILRNLFGADAEAIIAQIHELNAKKQEAYKTGGEGNSQAAQAAAESESQSVANINQLLRNLFGPEAEAIIAQIHELNAKKQGAYKEGGETAGAGAQEGGELEAQGVEAGSDAATGAIEDSATAQDVALGKLRDVDFSAIISGLPFINSAFSDLAGGFLTGGVLSAQGAVAAQGSITTGINGFSNLSPLISSIFGNVSGTVQTQGSLLAGQFQAQGTAAETAARVALTGISGTFGTEGGRLSTTIDSVFNSLTGAQNSGASGFSSILNSTFGNLNGAIGSGYNLTAQGYQQGGNQAVSAAQAAFNALTGTQNSAVNSFVGALNSTFGNANRAIGSGYTLTAQGYQQGSSKSVSAIQAAYNAEESKFRSESAALQGAIANAKGSERAKLIAEYSKLQSDHAAKSRAYQSAIAQASGQEKSALASGASAVISQLGSYGSSIAGKTASEFGGLISSFTSNSSRYKSAIDTQSGAIKRALEAAGKAVSSFKFPALAAPPKLPNLSGFTQFTADAPDHTVSSYSGFSPVTTAHAADGFGEVSSYAPTYASATRAFAAGESLFDQLGAYTQSLGAAQSALNVSVNVTGDLGRSLALPIGLLDRAADLLWQTAKYERETALINRETVQKMGQKEGRSAFQMARKPRKTGP